MYYDNIAAQRNLNDPGEAKLSNIDLADRNADLAERFAERAGCCRPGRRTGGATCPGAARVELVNLAACRKRQPGSARNKERPASRRGDFYSF